MREAATQYFGRNQRYGTDLRLSGYRPSAALDPCFGQWGNTISSDIMTSDFMAEMVSDFIATADPTNQLAYTADAPAMYWDRRVGMAYRIYRFFKIPAGFIETVAEHDTDGACRRDPYILRSIWAPPHRLLTSTGAGGLDTLLGVGARLGDEVWYAVVDEFASLDDAVIPAGVSQSGMPTLAVDPGPTPVWGRPTGRRVIAYNALGLQLWSRYYEVSDAGFTLADADGYRERFEYDGHGRLIKQGSRGWGAAEADATIDEDVEGLVWVYEYDDPASAFTTGSPAPGTPEPNLTKTPSRVYIQSGWANSSKYLVSQRLYDEHRSDLLRGELTYTVPTDLPFPDTTTFQNTLGGTALGTFTLRTYREDLTGGPDPTDPGDGKVHTQITVRGKAPTSPGSLALYAVEADAYDEEGRLEFRGHGLVDDPAAPGSTAGDIFFIDFFGYNDESELVLEVRDIEYGASYNTNLESKGSDPAWLDTTTVETYNPILPTGWLPAHPEDLTAHEYETERYYGQFGPERTDYPNERSEIITYRKEVQEFEEWRYEGLVWISDGSGGGHWEFRDPGQIKVYMGGTMVSATTAYWGSTQVDPTGFTSYTPVYEVKVDYDPSGRPTAAAVDGSDGQSESVSVGYDQFGLITRQREADGTLTRQVVSHRGQPIKTYRGTQDLHEVWGTAAPGNPMDNMALVETRTWGEGVTNAGELAAVRRFRNPLDDPYDLAVSDDVGYWERYTHDWRMRQFAVTQHDDGAGQDRLRTTVTYLDHAGRPRVVAVYGYEVNPAAVPPDLPVPTMDPGEALPGTLIADLLGAPRAPRRLSETIYDARGNVKEQREYNVADTSGASYLTTETYYDHAGRPLWMRSPGGGVQTFVYDAFGRQVKSSTWAPLSSGDLEVQRTETIYDPDGNAIEVTSYDRIDGTIGSLATESIVTRAHHWYDQTGRVICTADLGTGGGATFQTSGETIERAAVAPVRWTPTTGSWADDSAAAPYTEAKITAYRYDGAGNRTGVYHPDGTWTRHVYDSFGKVILTQENQAASDLSETSITAYEYEHGRMVRIAAVMPGHDATGGVGLVGVEGMMRANWDAADNTLQITEFRYGADAVEVTGGLVDSPPIVSSPRSRNNGWVGSIHFSGDGGQPSATPDLTFTYYVDGKLATRTDRRGVTFTHIYDAQGNRIRTWVSYPYDMDGSGLRTEDLVERIELAYDAVTGELTLATAYSSDEDPQNPGEVMLTVVAQNEFSYDPFGSLLSEAQAYGGPVDGATPTIAYQWDFASGAGAGANRNRLAQMTYPQHADSTFRRVIELAYGDAQNEIDDLLSRITAINDITGATKSLAQYAYTGSGRRVQTTLGVDAGGPASGFASQLDLGRVLGANPGYTKLDRFGRPADHTWTDDAGVAQYGALHGFDKRDNRLYARVTHRDGQQNPAANTRSHLWAYDGLSRLMDASFGALNSTNDGMELSPLARSESWDFDRLGNWTADGLAGSGAAPTLPGYTLTGDIDGTGVDQTTTRTHEVDNFNAIEAEITDLGLGTESAQTFIYDASGNLVFDGEYWYRYDGWGRLCQVFPAGPLTAGDFEDGTGPGGDAAKGRLKDTAPGINPSTSIVHFTYDALGRLIARQAPWPGLPGEIRTEIYKHDGVRRIQETWRDPVTGNGSQGGQNQNGGGGTVTYADTTEREYVHSPGYVDELVCEIDTGGPGDTVWWVLQDANYSVVALVSDGDGSLLRGQVARQYAWSPYGELLRADVFDSAAPMSRLGHQGLFHDRLDAGVTSEPMAAFSSQLVQNRNRTLSPRLGRFFQRDPNGTQASLLEMMTSRGIPPLSAASHESLFGDGVNVYPCLSQNPLSWTDPTGLFGLGSIAMTGMDLALNASDTLEEARQGLLLILNFKEMIEEYSLNQELDADWATDWSLGDFDYSSAGAMEWDGSFDDDGTDLVMAGRRKATGKGRLRGVSRKVYNARRAQFERMRPSLWKKEARLHPERYTEKQLKAMRRGEAPLGSDDLPMVIHHRRPLFRGGTNNWRNFDFMEMTEHWARYKELHFP
ncbi:MAG: hypothetical protein ACF8R7_16190 [Phycisphaerales bacterium JB039]